MTTKKTTTLDKRGLFLSATKFAVVGASTNPSKNGSKALKWLLDHHKDVTPVNLKASEIQGIKCVKTLSELPDPTHTSVSIVVPPKATLEVLQQAKALGIFALWLQPGAEDDAVVNFIQADAQLDERCIYRMHALHEHTPAPSRTRSKPDPLSTSTNLPPKTAASINTKSAETATPDRRALFLGASKFAVVGASANPAKNGFKALKWLVEHHKDVVPINLKASEIQGIKCMKALSELPDPTHTSVSIVVPPKVTLEILQQAKALGIFALWLQPGAEDDAVVKFIQADAQLEERCIYKKHALHAPGPFVNALVTGAGTLQTEDDADTPGQCLFAEPSTVDAAAPSAVDSAASSAVDAAVPLVGSENETMHTDTNGQCLFAEPSSVAAAVPLVASNLAAGIKHMLSPPSTPPIAKSLKLSPDDSANKTGGPMPDLGEGIPGIA